MVRLEQISETQHKEHLEKDHCKVMQRTCGYHNLGNCSDNFFGFECECGY